MSILGATVTSAVSLLAAAVIAIGFMWAAWIIACKSYTTSRISVRWCAAALLFCWMLVVAFYALSALRQFRLPAALVSSVVLAVAAGGRRARFALDTLAGDLRAFAASSHRIMGSRWRWALWCVVLLVSLRACRAMMTPPLSIDALTYQLVKPADWIRAGGWVGRIGPDVWKAYEYYPPVGNILWAWAMLPSFGDQIIGLAGFLVWALCLLPIYAVMRELGQGARPAAIGAVTLALTPAILKYSASCHVDNTALAFYCLAVLFVLRSFRYATTPDFFLAGAALGLAAGTKTPMLYVCALGLAVVAVGVWRKCSSFSGRSKLALLVLLAASIGLPGYLRAWIEMGSPMYPYPFMIGPIMIHPGNAEINVMMAGHMDSRFEGGFTWPDFVVFLYLQLFPYPGDWLMGLQFLNLGPLVAILIGLAVRGARPLLRDRDRLFPALFLIFAGLVPVAGILSKDMVHQRVMWAAVSGRFLTSTLVSMGFLACTLRPDVLRLVWVVGLVFALLYAIPMGWVLADIEMIALLALLLSPGVLFLVLGMRKSCGGNVRWFRIPGVVLMTMGFAAALGPVRSAYRFPMYDAFGRFGAPGCAYDTHPVPPLFASSWPVWKHFHSGPPCRVAVTAGFGLFGHNWYLYPLTGDRLKNEVLYVTPTRDGSIPDYFHKEETERASDFDAWIERLRRNRIEYVVGLSPLNLEASWMVNHPELFRAVVMDANKWNAGFKFLGNDKQEAAP